MPVADPEGARTGYVHSYETGGAVDGPGVRFVLFMNGCQMRCQYCHNPDTWKEKAGRLQTVAQTAADIGKYAPFLQAAGGLTISGGEPLLQAGFVGALARRVKDEHGLHVALDTNGAFAGRLPDRWFDPVDLVLLDLKHIDPARHQALTATPLAPVLESAQRLARMGMPLWIRYVLVPGWTDDEAHVERMADFVARLPTVERVEVLPFHNMAAYKWEAMAGSRYALADTPSPTLEAEARVRACFAARGLETA
ncbi:MAG: pyruvate formate lyase-activating protein [Betaproteobacteria bacterium]|nr:pyruvate formate lyase-activating protein [Betaproteobacteria bacterium]